MPSSAAIGGGESARSVRVPAAAAVSVCATVATGATVLPTVAAAGEQSLPGQLHPLLTGRSEASG